MCDKSITDLSKLCKLTAICPSAYAIIINPVSLLICMICLTNDSDTETPFNTENYTLICKKL